MDGSSSYLALFDLIGVLARKRHQIGERSFAALGLNHTEARLLTLLSQQDGNSTQETLSGLMLLDRSNAGRALKALEAGKFVVRSKDLSDGRTNSVQMTRKGHKAAADIAKMRTKIAESLFRGITEEQARTAVQLLKGAIDAKTSIPLGGGER